MIKEALGIFKMFRFFVTGSRAYGPVTIDSDLDIAVNRTTGHFVKAILRALNISYYDVEGYGEAASFYFDMGSLKINIVVLKTDKEFELWQYRTQMMKRINPVEDKELRKQIFNSIFPIGTDVLYFQHKTGWIDKVKNMFKPVDEPYHNSFPDIMPNPPTVDGFTYSQWKEANPQPDFEEMMLSMPKFAPFHNLIRANKFLKGK